jgi:integrase
LRHSIDGRQAGPVFLSRRHLNRTNPRVSYTTENELLEAFRSHIRKLSPREIQCANDWKQHFRRFLIQCGGVSSDAVSKAFKGLLQRTGITSHIKLYDLRSSVSTDLENAGVSHLVQRYVTGHTTSDIMNEYVALDPDAEMQKHFLRIAPLLDAIHCRAIELGIEIAGCDAV